jgi:hypothetical protein
MLSRSLCGSLLALGAAATILAHAESPAASVPPAASTVVVEDLGKGAVALDGPWHFQLGDNSAWADPGFNDSQWEHISAETTWGLQGHASYVGYAWYRLRLTLSPAPGASPDFAMFLPPVDDTCEIYWNGVLIGRQGKLPPEALWYFNPPPKTLGLGPVRSGLLAVRVWKSPGGSFTSGREGGFTAAPFIGGPQAIGAIKAASDYEWLRRSQLAFALDSLYCLVAFIGLLIWLRDRRQMLLLWMAGFSGSVLLIDFLRELRIPFSFVNALGLSAPLFGVLSISIWYVLILLLALDEIPKLMRVVRILAIVEITAFSLDGLLVLCVPFFLARNMFLTVQWTDAVLTAIFTMLQALPLVLVAIAVLRPRRLAPERWLVAGSAFAADLIPAIRTALSQGSRFTHWTIADRIGAPLFTINGSPVNVQALASTLLLISIVFAVYRYSAEERRRQSALEQDLHNARELQRVLIPEAVPDIPGFTLTSAYKPALEVGGDFFQIIALETSAPGSTLVILGDVSGKGLKAAMAVSLIVGAIRTFAETIASPADILAGLNRRLEGRLSGGFATAIALRLDAGGRCIIATAGHPAPYLNSHEPDSRQTGSRELDLPGALPLGLAPSASYNEIAFEFREGDHLALYTDGLLEARSPSGELFGFTRLQELFAAKPIAAEAAEAAVQFGQDDDITVLTLVRLAAGEQPAALHAAPVLT